MREALAFALKQSKQSQESSNQKKDIKEENTPKNRVSLQYLIDEAENILEKYTLLDDDSDILNTFDTKIHFDSSQDVRIKEVPEDVLRSILE